MSHRRLIALIFIAYREFAADTGFLYSPPSRLAAPRPLKSAL
jgi:hypothetical protein